MDAAEGRTSGTGGAGRAWLLALALVSATGCASDFERRVGPDGPYLEHKRLGYFIAEAPADGAPPESLAWRRAKVPDSDLAYRNDEGAAVSLSSRCRRTRASVAALARQLTIGTSRDALLAAGPIEHRGDDGWTQTFDTEEEGVQLRVKTITLLVGVCIYDWLLVAPGPGPFVRAEPGFDGWMESFVPPPSGPDEDVSPVGDEAPEAASDESFDAAETPAVEVP